MSETNRETLEKVMQVQWDLAQLFDLDSTSFQHIDQTLAKLAELPTIDGCGLWALDDCGRKFELQSACGMSSFLQGILKVILVNSQLGQSFAGCSDSSLGWRQNWADYADYLLIDNCSDVEVLTVKAAGPCKYIIGAFTHAGQEISEADKIVLATVANSLGERLENLKDTVDLHECDPDLEFLFNALGDLILMVDDQNIVVSHNEGFLSKLGYEQGTLVNGPIDKVLQGGAAMLTKYSSDDLAESKSKKSKSIPGRVIGPDGGSLSIEVRIIDQTWEGQKTYYVICRDVSHWHKMALERNRLVTAIEQASESFVVSDSAGIIEYVNPHFLKLTEYTLEEVLGKNAGFNKSGRHDPAFYSQMWDTLTRGETWHGRLLNSRKDGSLLTEEGSISPIRDENGKITHFVAVKRDVSSETVMEEKLRQTQKMEAIGTLTGGIAHDFNNILYALTGYTQLALDDVQDDHPARPAIVEIGKTGERASILVKKMLTFSRNIGCGRVNVDLTAVVNEALELARVSLPATIEFNIDLIQECPPVLADASAIHQAIFNLCTNSQHAIGDSSGLLSVSLDTVDLDLSAARAWHNLPPGRWAQLQVRDNGRGIEASVIDRVFEPYFTTKKYHEGTGLGLATVHGIVAAHDGRIYIDSEVGVGTAFTIFLPLCKVTDVVATDLSGRTNSSISNSESADKIRVMVIDDEAMIVDVAIKALTRYGFDVIGFTNGIEALEVFRSDPSYIDVVITDQTMPNITGFEVAAELHSIRAELPIILTTGYGGLADDEKMREQGFASFLSKPLKISDLAEAVERVTAVTVER